MELKERLPSNWPYILSIIIAATLWGLDGVVLTPRLYDLPVPLVVCIMHLIPFILMSPFFIYRFRRQIGELLRSRDLITAFAVSLLGGAIGTLAIVKALFLVNFDHLSVVVLLQKLQPVFALMLAHFLLGERQSRRFLIFACLALFASYLLTFGWGVPRLDGETPLLHASLYSLIAAFSFGASTVLGRRLVLNFPFPVVHYIRFSLTSLIMLVWVLLTGSFIAVSLVTPAHLAIFFIIAFTTGSGAVFLYYFGLQKVRASVSTICELFFPLSAIFFDYMLYGHILSPVQWLGAAILLFSIIKIAFLMR